MDNLDLLEVYSFSQGFRQRKLQTISDPLARNLVAQLLTKDPRKRPNMVSKIVSNHYSLLLTNRIY